MAGTSTASTASMTALTLPDGFELDYGVAWRSYLQTSEARTALARANRQGHAAQRHPTDLFAGYRPHRRQWEAHSSLARFRVVVAGRRGGKTVFGAREFLRLIFRNRDRVLLSGARWHCPSGRPKRQTAPLLHYWAVAPTYQLGLVQQREISRALRRHPELVISWVDNRLWLSGGVLVEFRSAEHPNALVGEGISGVWIDEAARCKKAAWHENIRPALSDHGGWGIFTSTPLGRNWLYDIWCEAKLNSEYSAHTWFSTDNTARPEVIEDARKAKLTMPSAVYRRNFEADWDAFDGQIFEEFSHRHHVVAPSRCPTEGERYVAGQDWGFSNPGCQLEIIRRDGRLYVVRETYERRMHVTLPHPGLTWVGVAQQAQRRGCEKFWCDPSSSENIDHFYSAGLDAEGAANSVVDGIECMSMMLHHTDAASPKLVFSSDCENLIRELPGYHYAMDPRGVSLERPVKTDDHAVDALRYGVHSEESYKDLVPGFSQLRLVR